MKEPVFKTSRLDLPLAPEDDAMIDAAWERHKAAAPGKAIQPAHAAEKLVEVAQRAVSGESMTGDAKHDLSALLSSLHYALIAYETGKIEE